jgi:hypothetical protein
VEGVEEADQVVWAAVEGVGVTAFETDVASDDCVSDAFAGSGK